MLNLLLTYNFSLLLRRLVTGASAALLGLLLSACESHDGAQSLAVACFRSVSTLAPIMGGQGAASCTTARPGPASGAAVGRTATAAAKKPGRALVASSR